MTALHIGPQYVWLLVFGGYPNIADTIIIELSEHNACTILKCKAFSFSRTVKGKNDQWSVQGTIGGNVLISCSKYQERLRKAMQKSSTAVRRTSDARKVIEQKIVLHARSTTN